MDAAIYKANEKMKFLANDKEVLRLYNMREMAQIDYNSGMKKAKEEGIEEGIMEVARNALRMKMSIDDIIKLTGLSRKQVENLKV